MAVLEDVKQESVQVYQGFFRRDVPREDPKRVNDAVATADDLSGTERQAFVEKRLAEIETELGR